MSENVIAIIQARMGSTRLAGKTMVNICGRPLIQHVVERLTFCKQINQIIVATTIKSEDDNIINFCKKTNIKYFRGEESDVLDRFYQCAKKIKADIIVRVTADDPFKDPQIIDQVIKEIVSDTSMDYVSNTIFPSYPIGIDIEALRFSTLKTIWKYGKSPDEREHVTSYIIKNRHLFKTTNIENPIDLSHHRWTLDTSEDLKFTTEVYKRLYTPGKIFYMDEILRLLEKEPELSFINSHIKQKGV